MARLMTTDDGKESNVDEADGNQDGEEEDAGEATDQGQRNKHNGMDNGTEDG